MFRLSLPTTSKYPSRLNGCLVAAISKYTGEKLDLNLDFLPEKTLVKIAHTNELLLVDKTWLQPQTYVECQGEDCIMCAKVYFRVPGNVAQPDDVLISAGNGGDTSNGGEITITGGSGGYSPPVKPKPVTSKDVEVGAPAVLAAIHNLDGTVSQATRLFKAPYDTIVTRVILQVTDSENTSKPPNCSFGTIGALDNVIATHTMLGATDVGDIYQVGAESFSRLVAKGESLYLDIVAGANSNKYILSCTVLGVVIKPKEETKVTVKTESNAIVYRKTPKKAERKEPKPKQILKQHRHANECRKQEQIAFSRERIAVQCAKYDFLGTCVRWLAAGATIASGLYFWF
jgi:hypothetical protein